MPETAITDDPAYKNMDLLRSSEYGYILRGVYESALDLDPRLENVEFIPMPDGDPGIARASSAWRSDTGKHEIHINLGEVDDTLKKMTTSMDAIPGARELFAEKIGVGPDGLTSEVMLAFTLGHELGHVSEFMDNESDPTVLEARVKAEKLALPIGNATVSAIMQEGTVVNSYVRKNWNDISDRLGVTNFGELLEAQHTSYRSMTSENFADNFASAMFAMNPTMIDQLSGPNRAEYRELPVEVYG